MCQIQETEEEKIKIKESLYSIVILLMAKGHSNTLRNIIIEMVNENMPMIRNMSDNLYDIRKAI